jgi:hypothetical protein
VAPDCPVPQEDKVSNGRLASNPNVVAHRTAHSTCPMAHWTVRCTHRQQPWPIATMWLGAINTTPTTTTIGIQVFQRSHSIQELVHSLQDTFLKIKPSPSAKFISTTELLERECVHVHLRSCRLDCLLPFSFLFSSDL